MPLEEAAFMTSSLTSTILPLHIDPNALVPDPSRRAGVWLNPDTDEVFALPPDWTPQGSLGEFARLTEADLAKMNKGQMAKVADAVGVSGYDKMSKADATAAILAALARVAASLAPASENDSANDLTGRDVRVLTGPNEGQVGVISETGGEGDDFAVRVVLASGTEVAFTDTEKELHFLTPEEVAAAVQAAKDAAN